MNPENEQELIQQIKDIRRLACELNFDGEDLIKLADSFSYLQDAMDSFANYLMGLMTSQKESAAREKARAIVMAGIKFKDLNIDGVCFTLDETGALVLGSTDIPF